MDENVNPQVLMSPLNILQPKPTPSLDRSASSATAASSTAGKKRKKTDTDIYKTSAVKSMKLMTEKGLIDNPGDEANAKLVIDKYIELNTNFDAAVSAATAEVMAAAAEVFKQERLWQQQNTALEKEQKETIAAAKVAFIECEEKRKEYVELCNRCQIMMGELQGERLEVLADKDKMEKKSDKEWARVAKCLQGVREQERKQRELLVQIQRRRTHGKGANSDEACKSGS